MNKPILYLVTPCFNEEEALKITTVSFVDKLKELMAKGKIDRNSKIIFVDDGSKDNTWNIIKEVASNNKEVKGISLKENRGQQIAMFAGIMEAKDNCDIVITLDCDGQHDISIIEEMVSKYLNGNDVVYAVRKTREADSFFKGFTAQAYYYIANLVGVRIVPGSSDYRLISNKVINDLKEYEGRNIFLRGMIPQLDYKNDSVEYDVLDRVAGEPKYTIKKMLKLAFGGFTWINDKRVLINLMYGIVIVLLSLVYFFSNNSFRKEKVIRIMMIFVLLFGLFYLLLSIYVLINRFMNKNKSNKYKYEIKEKI